jgi:propeptide pepSY amd peptidase M4
MKISNNLIKSKLKATFIHFIISLFIFTMIVVWMLYSLYPSIYFNMSGGKQGLWLMFCVDLVLGPLLTFLVFNPSKKTKEIISDFLVIGIVQMMALGYGFHTVYMQRPKLAVVYDMGSAIMMNAQEVADDESLKSINLDTLSEIEGKPFAGLVIKNNEAVYVNLHDAANLVETVDKLGRRSLDKQESDQLAALEKQHGKVFVISLAGKYMGAYLILDKNLNFIEKIGEKPMI